MTGRGSGAQAGGGRREEARVGRYGFWTIEDSVSAEKCQKAIWTKEKNKDMSKRLPKAALVYTCTVCRTQIPNPKTFRQPFERKHPDSTSPELAVRC